MVTIQAVKCSTDEISLASIREICLNRIIQDAFIARLNVPSIRRLRTQQENQLAVWFNVSSKSLAKR